MPVVKDLEQDVKDIWVGLLDFVQEDDGVRFLANLLGQLAAFFMAYITRRRTNQARHGVFLHVLGHVDPNHIVLGTKHGLGQGLGQFGLTNPGWP